MINNSRNKNFLYIPFIKVNNEKISTSSNEIQSYSLPKTTNPFNSLTSTKCSNALKIHFASNINYKKLFENVIGNIENSVKSYDQKTNKIYLSTDNNKVIVEGNKLLERDLNILCEIAPQFKKTIVLPDTHHCKIIEHLLDVTREVVTDKKYLNLTNEQKFIAKVSALFHDMEKLTGGKRPDSEHPFKSAVKTKLILKSLNIEENKIDSIFNLIRCHHWIGKVKTKKWNVELVANAFNLKPQDFEICKILSTSDVKAGKNKQYINELDTIVFKYYVPEIENLLKKLIP